MSSQPLMALNPSTHAVGLLNLSNEGGKNALLVSDAKLAGLVLQVLQSLSSNTPTLFKPVSLQEETDGVITPFANGTNTTHMIDVRRVVHINIFYEDKTLGVAPGEGEVQQLEDDLTVAIMGRIGVLAAEEEEEESGDPFQKDADGNFVLTNGKKVRKFDFRSEFVAAAPDEQVDVELLRFQTKNTGTPGVKDEGTTFNRFVLSDLNVRGISRVYLRNISGKALTNVKIFVSAQF